MSIVRITKEFHYEGAHALIDYDGKCKHIHGHSYKLFVTVKGTPSIEEDNPKNGMIMDFNELKSIVNDCIISIFDHSLVIREGAPLANELKSVYKNVVILPFQPTCENLILHFAKLLEKKMAAGVTLCALRLYETETSYVEWFSYDN